jgi:hypothetical protein
MKYVGIDLHKKTISICVVNQERLGGTPCKGRASEV